MNSDQPSVAKRIFTFLVIAVGAVLLIRLVVLAVDPWTDRTPESMEAFRDRMKRAAWFERDQTEKMWIDSGKPLPPGGYDEVWRRANGLAPGEREAESDTEVLSREQTSP